MARFGGTMARCGEIIIGIVVVLLGCGVIAGPIAAIVVVCNRHPNYGICLPSRKCTYFHTYSRTVGISDDDSASSLRPRDGVLSTAGAQSDFNATFHAENITMSMCQHPAINDGNLPSPAFYRDCNALQNKLRNQTGFWETSGWAAAVGDQKEILLQAESCVVTLDRPDEGTEFVL